MSIGEFAPIYSAFTGIKYESLAQVKYILKNVEILLHVLFLKKILSILFVMISGVILINTLIAAMVYKFLFIVKIVQNFFLSPRVTLLLL